MNKKANYDLTDLLITYLLNYNNNAWWKSSISYKTTNLISSVWGNV